MRVMSEQIHNIQRLISLVKRDFWEKAPDAAKEMLLKVEGLLTDGLIQEVGTVVEKLWPLRQLSDFLQTDTTSYFDGVVRMHEVYTQLKTNELLVADSVHWIDERPNKGEAGIFQDCLLSYRGEELAAEAGFKKSSGEVVSRPNRKRVAEAALNGATVASANKRRKPDDYSDCSSGQEEEEDENEYAHSEGSDDVKSHDGIEGDHSDNCVDEDDATRSQSSLDDSGSLCHDPTVRKTAVEAEPEQLDKRACPTAKRLRQRRPPVRRENTCEEDAMPLTRLTHSLLALFLPEGLRAQHVVHERGSMEEYACYIRLAPKKRGPSRKQIMYALYYAEANIWSKEDFAISKLQAMITGGSLVVKEEDFLAPLNRNDVEQAT
ncbi:hypothetical protein FOZ63_029493, partial [Perkinsus olseni]